MKVLFVAHNAADPSQGAANADLSLLAAMRERGHDVDDIWDVGIPRSVRHDNLHLLVEAPRKCERVVVRQLARACYDLVFVNQPLGWRSARAVRGYRPAPLFVGRSHGWEPRVFAEQRRYLGGDGRGRLKRTASTLLRFFLDRQNQLLLRYADGLVVPSRDDRDYLVANSALAGERVLQLPPGIPMTFLQTPSQSLTADRCRRMLHVGQFASFKAPRVVAAVLAMVLARRADATASWVCAARDHAKVKALLPEDLHSRVALSDWMPREKLREMYDAHGVYVFPSVYEGFAQTFLEAMARGMAVLATNVDGMAQAIRSGENGFLFERERPAEMADVALSLMGGGTDVARLGLAARRSAAEYTWARSAEMIEAFFSFLLRAGKR